MLLKHCLVCAATDFPLLCLFLFTPSWTFGPKGTVAELANQTKSTKIDSSKSIPLTSDSLTHDYHKENHDSFEINDTILYNVATQFTSSLFAKYGFNNQSLLRIELLYLFHKLGLGGHMHFDTSESEHNQDIHDSTEKGPGHNEIQKHEHTHTGSKKLLSSYRELDKDTHVHTNTSRLHHDDNHDLHNDHDHDEHNETVMPETSFRPEHSDHTHEEATTTSTSKPGGKKRRGKSGRRAKKGRKQPKKKKQDDDDQASKRIPRGIAERLQNDHGECLKQILRAFSLEKKERITVTDFIYMSSAIIYHLDVQNCSQVTHNFLSSMGSVVDMSHNHLNLGHDHDLDHDHVHDHDLGHQVTPDLGQASSESTSLVSTHPEKVWGFSFLAVLIISLVGLLGVAIIPMMHRVFYNHLLQFLVALAVGTLTADALIHLLPHSLNSHHSHHNHGQSRGGGVLSDEETMTLKGLVAVLSLFLFYVMERVLVIHTERKRKQKKMYAVSSHGSVASKLPLNPLLARHLDSESGSCDEMSMMARPNRTLQLLADDAHEHSMHEHTKHNHEHCAHRHREPKSPLSSSVGNGTDGSQSVDGVKTIEGMRAIDGTKPYGADASLEEEIEILMPRSAAPRSVDRDPHGHSHGMLDEQVPDSVAAIAWMVILGDGIHNFSDGLAIGASFASDILTGFSTTIAVFCHELPHEIGDFAVLLRAGMSIRSAIVYNVVSSVLCFFGMFVGIGLGNIHEAAEWIFACVAGMFIYIALVDMLPEMTSIETKEGENPFYHLLYQVAGIGVGTIIMLLIAIYEDDLLHIFN